MTTTLEYKLLAVQRPEDNLWFWMIVRTETGKVLERSNHHYVTEEACRDAGSWFIGDWFAGYTVEATAVA
jgi:hypothetical protein